MQLIGQVLQETYRIERLLGRGGKGEVYLASHQRLPRQFAIKVLFPHNAFKPEEVVRFRREAEVVSAIGHPHLIEVIDFNHTSWGAPYIVMEYLAGEDLSARLKRVERLDVRQTGTILKQVCSALQATHQQGVIHRDLKPSNIFLCRKADREDYVKVVDFGLSKVWGASVAVTNARLAIGTPRYMAPEQAMGRSSEADVRTDVFSMGAILFRSLTGELPFIGDSVSQLLNNIVFVDPPEVSELAPEVPEAVSKVVNRALSKGADDRFQSMDELWDAYQRASGLGFSTQSLSARVSDSAETSADVPLPHKTKKPDPVPELSATFTHTLGEMVDAETAARTVESVNTTAYEERQRRKRRATGLIVLGAAGVVAAIGVWIGLHLVDDPQPAKGPLPRVAAAAQREAGPPSVVELKEDSGHHVVTLRKRPDAAVRRSTTTTRVQPKVPPKVRPRVRPKVRPRVRTPVRRRRFGGLKIITRSGGRMIYANAYLDGRKVGQTPKNLQRVAAGRHLVKVERPDLGYRPLVRTVTVQPNQVAKVILEWER